MAMARVVLLLCCLLLLSSGCWAFADEEDNRRELGFVGRRGNDLYFEAPQGGLVFVDGVDVVQLKQDFQALEEEHKADVKLLQRALCDAGLVDFVSVAQAINTKGAFDWEHFVINDIHFLAVASYATDGGSYSIPSVIYQWNINTKQFEQIQSINTNGATDWEHFEIDGVHFLCVANHFNGNTHRLPSVIYQWNTNTKQFEQIQSINTNGAYDWEHFEIDGVHFLSVANARNGNVFNVPSIIYRWNTATKQFEQIQSINTIGATDWEHFEIDGLHYLSVANYYNGNTFNIPSVIYQWNSSTKQFEQIQSINTNTAIDWEHFVIDGVHFLSVANNYNGNNYNIPSVIYRWNSSTKQFEQAQAIDTIGAYDWEHFVIDGAHFLSVANSRDGTTWNIPSFIYRWNTATQQFEEAQSIDTHGAYNWEHFEIDGIHFLSVANSRDGQTFSIPSVVYQFNPLCV